jgi:hypothetical protein
MSSASSSLTPLSDDAAAAPACFTSAARRALDDAYA